MSPVESRVRAEAARLLGQKASSLNAALHATGHNITAAERVFDAMAKHAHARMTQNGGKPDSLVVFKLRFTEPLVTDYKQHLEQHPLPRPR